MWCFFDGFLGYGGGSFLRVSGFLMGVFLLLCLGASEWGVLFIAFFIAPRVY